MAEEGRVFASDTAGGRIDAAAPSPVDYDADAVVGSHMPRAGQTVCFERDPANAQRAASVRSGSCAAARIADDLKSAFDEYATRLAMNEAAEAEVWRLAESRALRVLRAPPGTEEVRPELLDARLALARAAMKLIAVEAGALDDEVSAEAIRDALRRQRPPLPRR